MTIQIARRIGAALNVKSQTRIKELDTCLREYVRSVSSGAALPILGSIDWSHITSIPATFPPAAHTHPNGDLTGYTAADVLAKLITVDGAGSGLDADLLDGISSAGFAIAAHMTSGTWTPADGSGAGLVLTVTDARYVKHDTLVIASARITYPVTASGAQATLSGLPFAVNANQSSRQGNVSYSDAAAALFIVPDAGASTAKFFAIGGGAAANSAVSAATVFFQLIYQT